MKSNYVRCLFIVAFLLLFISIPMKLIDEFISDVFIVIGIIILITFGYGGYNMNKNDYVVICGSLSQEDDILEVATEFMSMGYNVYFTRKFKGNLIDKMQNTVHKIRGCDIFCYIEKPGGVIGESTSYEVAIAAEAGKKIIAIPANAVNIKEIINKDI